MEPKVYFVVNVDTDPDPEDTSRDDQAVLEKYGIMQDVLRQHADSKGIICVHSSPMYRERFFENQFMSFWQTWVDEGGELILHLEEDLYGTPETKQRGGSLYSDVQHMETMIKKCTDIMKNAGLPLKIYKGGYHGLTPEIIGILKKVGIQIEVTCAPDVDWPVKLADWGDSPVSAYYMSEASQRIASADKSQLFEIPFGWDGVKSNTSERFLLNEHYLVNEFSNYEAMCRVWDTIIKRSSRLAQPQFVGILCHTYTMKDQTYRQRLEKTLDYMTSHHGISANASEIKNHYDNSPA
jgi:hypothetical protein